MIEYCAVCHKGKGPTKCEICGFSDNGVINREFVVIEDANHWLETVVMPYCREWEVKKRENELLARIVKLEQRITKIELSQNVSTEQLQAKFIAEFNQRIQEADNLSDVFDRYYALEDIEFDFEEALNTDYSMLDNDTRAKLKQIIKEKIYQYQRGMIGDE